MCVSSNDYSAKLNNLYFFQLELFFEYWKSDIEVSYEGE